MIPEADPRRAEAAARDRAAADAARQALRDGLARAAAARPDAAAQGLAAAAQALAQAPCAVATHVLEDALVSVRLVQFPLAGIRAAATLRIDVLLQGGRIHLRRHGLLALSGHALDRIQERADGDADLADWCAAALPAVAGVLSSWPDGPVACPFGPGLLLGVVEPAQTLEDGAVLADPAPLAHPLQPIGRSLVGRTWVPEHDLVPSQAHLLRRLRRWTLEKGAAAVGDLCGSGRPAPDEAMGRLAASRAWRRCPQAA